MFEIKVGASLRDAVRRDIKSQYNGMNAVCDVIGVKHYQTIVNYTCNTTRETHTMSIDQLQKIIDWSGGAYIAQTVADLAGGLFIPVKPIDDDSVIVMDELVSSVNSLGDLVKEIREAVSDKKVDDSEWGRIRTAKSELFMALNRMVGLASHMRE